MNFIKSLLRYNLWFEHDVVSVGADKYLERWFLYLLGFTFRLHKFYHGDDDRAPHDHPWAFVTFPLTGYFEKVFGVDPFGDGVIRYVAPWRFHYRPAMFQHIVLGSTFTPAYGDRPMTFESLRPFFTFVITSRKQRSWGFWPVMDTDSLGTKRRFYVPWRQFNASR